MAESQGEEISELLSDSFHSDLSKTIHYGIQELGQDPQEAQVPQTGQDPQEGQDQQKVQDSQEGE